MQVRLLVSFCFLFVSTSVRASSGLLDSIGVENVEGKKVIVHRVEPHETYYSIARKYDVSARSISDFYHTSVLKVGDVLKVQTDLPFECKNAPLKSVRNKKESYVTNYKVNSKETLYAIAKKFGMTVDEVKELNKLKSDDLSVGKILKVKRDSDSSLKLTEVSHQRVVEPGLVAKKEQDRNLVDESKEVASDNVSSRLRGSSVKYGLRETTERGIAVCLSDENLDGTKMLALHRTAPIGTVIKITNPMTQRSTFAKVVGTFTENESTKNVTIILTKAVADLLGALDKKFQVSLTYGIPNE